MSSTKEQYFFHFKKASVFMKTFISCSLLIYLTKMNIYLYDQVEPEIKEIESLITSVMNNNNSVTFTDRKFMFPLILVSFIFRKLYKI